MYTYNSTTRSSTGKAPFELLMNYIPYLGLVDSITDISSIDQKRDEVQAQLKLAQDSYKKFYNRATVDQEFQIGQKVWLETTHIPIDRPSRKLDHRRVGPFKILEKVGAVSYRLKLPITWRRIHPVFHASLLMKFMPGDHDKHLSGRLPTQAPALQCSHDAPDYVLPTQRQSSTVH